MKICSEALSQVDEFIGKAFDLEVPMAERQAGSDRFSHLIFLAISIAEAEMFSDVDLDSLSIEDLEAVGSFVECFERGQPGKYAESIRPLAESASVVESVLSTLFRVRIPPRSDNSQFI